MARRVTGRSTIDLTRKQLLQAKTINDLRRAQALRLPLDFDLSLEDTAKALGLSKGWGCQLRRDFIKEQIQSKQASVVRAKPEKVAR